MFKLSVVIPCYNEEKTLSKCISRVLAIGDSRLALQIVVVDDCSRDRSHEVALSLARRHPEVTVVRHERNSGKGAALRTGFALADGDAVAVQDADLEYDPNDLKRLLVPLIEGHADVVFGSRFLTSGPHRVLYFWHSMGNGFLTFVSNMFTDLNLTDMETCYKVFRRDVVQEIQIEEDRFGVEPELVAKVARMRLRIYEMGISYFGRTYAEGKKIRARDGLRALYCIFHYNAPTAPPPVQFLIYVLIGGISALFNLLVFLALMSWNAGAGASALSAYFSAAVLNYWLCITLLFRHKARWSSLTEAVLYIGVVAAGGVLDLTLTKMLLLGDVVPWLAKSTASLVGLFFNFLGRKYCVFPERSAREWKPQVSSEGEE